jgi:23S rRNA (adenine1618-N6)-methyltransferase
MHPNNIHKNSYDMDALAQAHSELREYLIINEFDTKTIDFANPKAVLHLNKAILKHHYGLTKWEIPGNYLCPPIPGRADYIHYIADLLTEEGIKGNIKGLDIGVGANAIYPILGNRIYNWKMLGADISKDAVIAAKWNISNNSELKDDIEIRHQVNNANIFEGIINKGEYYNFSMCNPPFHASKAEAMKGTLQKLKNLGYKEDYELNFGGQANELWCNGGEALFIKRMIKESVNFKTQVGWFTSLVSKKENLAKVYKQLNKLKASHKTIEMSQGNKKSRMIAWKF